MNDETNVVVEQASSIATDDSTAKTAKRGKKVTRVNGNGKSATREPIAPDTKATRSFAVTRPNVVNAVFTFKLHDGATERYNMESEFDFNNCSNDEILFLAASSVRITIQGKLRQMGDAALDVGTFAHVDVKSDVVDSTRSPMSDDVRSIRAIARVAKCSEEKAREIMAGLLAGTL